MTKKQWHFANWSPLGWLETFLKGLAMVIGISVLFMAISGPLALRSGGTLVQTIVMGVLALTITFGVVDRFIEREIFAMIFVVFNIFAHWGIFLGLMSAYDIANQVILYCVLMILGDLVKVRWLAVSGFTVRGLTFRVLAAFTTFFIVGYVVVLLAQIL